MIKVVIQSLYLQMDLESLLEHTMPVQIVPLKKVEVMYIFMITVVGSWTQVSGDIDGEAAVDNSGSSVSLSSDGSRVAIGATKNDGNGTNSGHVRIYKYQVIRDCYLDSS